MYNKCENRNTDALRPSSICFDRLLSSGHALAWTPHKQCWVVDIIFVSAPGVRYDRFACGTRGDAAMLPPIDSTRSSYALIFSVYLNVSIIAPLRRPSSLNPNRCARGAAECVYTMCLNKVNLIVYIKYKNIGCGGCECGVILYVRSQRGSARAKWAYI